MFALSVKPIVLVLVCAAALMLGGSAAAGLTVGVNDDAPKDADVAGWFYSTMASEGLTLDSMSLRWDDYAPSAIPDQASVANAIDDANAAGVSVELDLYPLHSQAFTDGRKCMPSANPLACGDSTAIQEFADWAGEVAMAFPTVHQFVVMNECNQPLFLNPQWNKGGLNQSAAICGRALAAAYDALKAVSTSNFVWGVGLSPRGNDSPKASSNSSTSPVKFLAALGQWFGAFATRTHRKAPLMDGLDFHPYPVPQSLPFATGYANPNDASVTNLPRIYAAFYTAFAGTPQKTIGQQPGGGLPISLNETGVQTVVPADSSAYTGVEVSASGAGGLTGKYGTQAYQATWYGETLNYVACDPNVKVINIFHLIDESALEGWQSGLYYADETPKQSAQIVASFIAGGSKCLGKMMRWTPTTATSVPALLPPSCTAVPCAGAGSAGAAGASGRAGGGSQGGRPTVPAGPAIPAAARALLGARGP